MEDNRSDDGEAERYNLVGMLTRSELMPTWASNHFRRKALQVLFSKPTKLTIERYLIEQNTFCSVTLADSGVFECRQPYRQTRVNLAFRYRPHAAG
jgi:hypothetical protein